MNARLHLLVACFSVVYLMPLWALLTRAVDARAGGRRRRARPAPLVVGGATGMILPRAVRLGRTWSHHDASIRAALRVSDRNLIPRGPAPSSRANHRVDPAGSRSGDQSG